MHPPPTLITFEILKRPIKSKVIAENIVNKKRVFNLHLDNAVDSIIYDFALLYLL